MFLSPAVQQCSETAVRYLTSSARDAFPRPASETMDADPWIPRPPDPRDLPESQLDFFHKLGYSTSQVQAVQLKFGPNVDTDKVLGELVRIGASREDKQGPVTTMSVLVPRGDTPFGGPEMLLPLSPPSLENRERNGDADALRAVVIDGSNVAMR